MNATLLPADLGASSTDTAGCYVYCVAPGGQEVRLGGSGLDGRDVYGIAQGDLLTLVHDCSALPYQSSDTQQVGAWVVAHHGVVVEAWRRFGTVLPLTFNTIVRAVGGSAPDGVQRWMAAERQRLEGRLKALAGKAEFAVHVSWEPALVSRQVAVTNAEIRALVDEVGTQPRGLAYMRRQKAELLLRRELEAWAARATRDTYTRLGAGVEAILVEKRRRDTAAQQVLASFSCLVSLERRQELEAAVRDVEKTQGLSLHLAGPLPPYSFC